MIVEKSQEALQLQTSRFDVSRNGTKLQSDPKQPPKSWLTHKRLTHSYRLQEKLRSGARVSSNLIKIRHLHFKILRRSETAGERYGSQLTLLLSEHANVVLKKRLCQQLRSPSQQVATVAARLACSTPDTKCDAASVDDCAGSLWLEPGA